MPDPGFRQSLLTYGPELNGNEGRLILSATQAADNDSRGGQEESIIKTAFCLVMVMR